MIIDNRSTESGDVLLIETDVPVLGIAFLSGFLDSTEGEDSNLYFVKKFRYSVNLGKTYTDWIPLTAENLQNLSFGEKIGLHLIMRISTWGWMVLCILTGCNSMGNLHLAVM